MSGLPDPDRMLVRLAGGSVRLSRGPVAYRLLAGHVLLMASTIAATCLLFGPLMASIGYTWSSILYVIVPLCLNAIVLGICLRVPRRMGARPVIRIQRVIMAALTAPGLVLSVRIAWETPGLSILLTPMMAAWLLGVAAAYVGSAGSDDGGDILPDGDAHARIP
jgi:hypothetical protein